MPETTCLECGRRILEATAVCPRCGHTLDPPPLDKLGAYVGEMWDSHYRGQFRRILDAEARGEKPGSMWNWAAALAPFSLWFLYRRLYAAFFAFLMLHLLIRAIGAPFLLVLLIVQGCRADKLLFQKAREVVRRAGENADVAWLHRRGKPLALAVWLPLLIPFIIPVLIAWSVPDHRPAQDGQAFTAAEAPPEVRVFTSQDGQTQITVPGAWQPLVSSNALLQLKVGNARTGEQVVTVTDAKTAIPPGVDLEWHAQASLKDLRERMRSSTVSEPVPMVIGGNSAVQYEILNNSDFPATVWWLTAIETPRNFHRIYATTGQNQTTASRWLVQEAILSFQETPR